MEAIGDYKLNPPDEKWDDRFDNMECDDYKPLKQALSSLWDDLSSHKYENIPLTKEERKDLIYIQSTATQIAEMIGIVIKDMPYLKE